MKTLQDRMDEHLLEQMRRLRSRCIAPELVEITDTGSPSGTSPRYRFRIIQAS